MTPKKILILLIIGFAFAIIVSAWNNAKFKKSRRLNPPAVTNVPSN